MYKIGIRSGLCLLWLVVASSARGELFDGGPDAVMQRALTECELAQTERLEKRPDKAQAHIDLFVSYRDQALKQMPALGNDDETGKSLRSCERLASIVARSSRQYQQQQDSIGRVVEESGHYVRECKLSLNKLVGETGSDSNLVEAESALARANAHKENVEGEWQAFVAFRNNLEHPSKLVMAEQMAEGDSCSVRATELITQKHEEAAQVARLLRPFEARLGASWKACEGVKSAAGNTATDANLEEASKLLRAAQDSARALSADMRKDRALAAYENWSRVAGLKRELTALYGCISSADSAVVVMAQAVRDRKQKLAKAEAARQAREREEAQRLAQARKEATQQAARSELTKTASPATVSAPPASASPTGGASGQTVDEIAERAVDSPGLTRLDERIEKARLQAAEAARAQAADAALAVAGRVRPGSAAERIERARMLAAEAAKSKATQEAPARSGNAILESLRR